MTDPVSRTELSLLSRGLPGAPWCQLSVDLVAAGGPGIDELTDLIAERLAFTPRFRQRVRESVAGVIWSDDAAFSLAHHVRRHELGPGADLADLQAYVGKLIGLDFDKAHPLWDLTLVTGLPDDQAALVTRVHPALVDGGDNVHLLQELYDDAAVTLEPSPSSWQPLPEPSMSDELLGALTRGAADPLGEAGRAVARLGLLAQQTLRLAQPPEPSPTPRVASSQVGLDALRRVRDAVGCTTHDVIVALVTAGIRQSQINSGQEGRDVVALVPLAVAEDDQVSAVGCQVAGQWVSLPVSTPAAGARLEQIASLTRSRIDSGRTVAARRLVELSGFAPPTLHCLAARSVVEGRPHEVLLANVPGPERERYLGGAMLLGTWSVSAPTDQEQLVVGVTTYRDRVEFGICGLRPLGAFLGGLEDELARLGGGA